MSKRNISRCTIPVKKAKDNMLFVKVTNGNMDYSREFKMNAFDIDSLEKELLPVYVEENISDRDTLKAEEEKVYKIDVTGVKSKVVFEIIQEKGGSSIGVSSKNKGSSDVEIRFK